MENLGKERFETLRLIIRKPILEDLDDLFQIHADPQTNLYNPAGPVKKKQDFESTLKAWIAHHNQYGFGYYVLIDKEDSQIFGVCGLMHKNIGELACLNVYYRISASKMRRGFITEAAKTIIKEVKGGLNQEYKIVALTLNTNIPSMKVARNLGLVHSPEWDHYDGEGNIYYFSG